MWCSWSARLKHSSACIGLPQPMEATSLELYVLLVDIMTITMREYCLFSTQYEEAPYFHLPWWMRHTVPSLPCLHWVSSWPGCELFLCMYILLVDIMTITMREYCLFSTQYQESPYFYLPWWMRHTVPSLPCLHWVSSWPGCELFLCKKWISQFKTLDTREKTDTRKCSP
jgi:hypothetical protein